MTVDCLNWRIGTGVTLYYDEEVKPLYQQVGDGVLETVAPGTLNELIYTAICKSRRRQPVGSRLY